MCIGKPLNIQDSLINTDFEASDPNIIFYQTVTHGHACTVTLEEYLDLCERCPQGYEQSLHLTKSPVTIPMDKPQVYRALRDGQAVVEPVLLF